MSDNIDRWSAIVDLVLGCEDRQSLVELFEKEGLPAYFDCEDLNREQESPQRIMLPEQTSPLDLSSKNCNNCNRVHEEEEEFNVSTISPGSNDYLDVEAVSDSSSSNSYESSNDGDSSVALPTANISSSTPSPRSSTSSSSSESSSALESSSNDSDSSLSILCNRRRRRRNGKRLLPLSDDSDSSFPMLLNRRKRRPLNFSDEENLDVSLEKDITSSSTKLIIYTSSEEENPSPVLSKRLKLSSRLFSNDKLSSSGDSSVEVIILSSSPPVPRKTKRIDRSQIPPVVVRRLSFDDY